MQNLLRRRSVRRFTDRDVAPDLIERAIRAAMHSPSAANERPWQFIVLRDQALRDQAAVISPYAAMIAQAPAGVLVCGDRSLERFPSQQFWVQDCAAATQSLMLALHALGVGSVWTAVYPLTDRIRGFQEMLSLPESVVPFALVPLGYPESEPTAVDRFESSKVHFDGW